MRPLQLVSLTNLKPGKMYLIQEKRPENADLKYKGTFVKNDYPTCHYNCIMTEFNNVVKIGNNPGSDLRLPDKYWNYYEADAVERAYINQALREITGDPSFMMEIS